MSNLIKKYFKEWPWLFAVFAVVLVISGIFIFSMFNSSKVYRKPLLNPVETLDPSLTRSRQDYMIAKNIFGQLISFDEFGRIKPAIIEKWSVDQIGQKYTFWLRKGVYFHNGRSVNMDDIIFTLHYLSRPNSLISNYFSNIDGFDDYYHGIKDQISGIEKIDKMSFSVQLKRRSYIFLSKLADPKVVLLPKIEVNQMGSKFFLRPIGAGPYQISEHSQKFIRLNKFSKYYEGNPSISTYELLVVSQEEAIELFNKGKVHDLEVFNIESSDLKGLKRRANVYNSASYSTTFLFLNGEKDIFKDRRFRKSFSRSINVQAIRFKCTLNIVPSASINPHGTMGHYFDEEYNSPINSKELKYLRQKAHQLKTFRILLYGKENNTCFIDELVSQLQSRLNVSIQPIVTELSEAIDIFNKGDYELFIDHLSIRGSEPYFLYSYFAPDSSHNLIKFRDNHISILIRQIEKNPIRDQRALLYRIASHYIVQEKAYVRPLFSDIRHYVFSPSVKSTRVPALLMTNLGFNDIWIR